MLQDSNQFNTLIKDLVFKSPPYTKKTFEIEEQNNHHELLYQQLFDKAKNIYEWAFGFGLKKGGSINDLKDIIEQIKKSKLLSKIIESLKMEDDLIFCVFMPKKEYDILMHNAVNVTILSLKIGVTINRYSENELKNLAIAALVHDLGMANITTQYNLQERRSH